MSSPDPRRIHLNHMLTRFAPFDEREAAFCARMRTLLAGDADPFDRLHYTPGHFTASAFILSPAHDAVLLVLHGKLHRWLQPGGHVDPDDPDVLSTARREVREETGIEALEPMMDGLFDVDVHAIPPLKGAPAHEHFDLRFLFRARGRETSAGSDARATRWVPLPEVSDVESDESVMRAVAKIRARVG